MHALPCLMTRREALRRTAASFGSLALADLCARKAQASNPLSEVPTHQRARAKRIVFLFMQGGPSHVDTFDYKPLLEKHDGTQMPFDDARTIANAGERGTAQRVMKSLWNFKQYGQSGHRVSDLFPAVAQQIDELCMIRSLHTEGVAHGPSTLFLHCGSTNLVRPSIGSWITYGLGSENENLPGFVSLGASSGNGGPLNYGNSFLPASYQGTTLGIAGSPAKKAAIRNLVNGQLNQRQQKDRFEFLNAINREQLKRTPGDTELEAVIHSFELAARMQANVPDIIDFNQETDAMKQLYGIGTAETDDFGRRCLMARQLCEAGVRYIQVTYGDNTANPAWDQRSNLPLHEKHARAVDQPIAGFLQDLKQRGLLEDTIVWWGGEFGRTPYAQKNGTGRDHNPGGFTMWLAGGGVQPALQYGATDDLGHKAVVDRVHMHDLHATLLHLMGLDHQQLTFNYAGRDFRLTDVHGRVIKDLLS